MPKAKTIPADVTVPSSSSPNGNKVLDRTNTICDSVLDVIGDTPMVRLNRIAANLPCEMLVKCEFFNAGGSVKDRIGKRMVEDAEKAGQLQRGDTLIEPTSGNTGIGIALAAAIKGYRCIITLPEKMSKEKVDVMKALGAEIIRTPTEASWDSPESNIGLAKKLVKEIPYAVILDQYYNENNPLAHYEGTGEEIWQQTGGHVDMVVVGAGTGGTITGIAKKLKERNPSCIVVGADPHGSILAQPEHLNTPARTYLVEGIGYDFIPGVLDRSLVDVWYKTWDKETFIMARKLIRDEGILCGGSSGTAMYAAVQVAASLKEDQVCVVILPDGVRNYMTKFLNDDWMDEKVYCQHTKPVNVTCSEQDKLWGKATVADLHLKPAVVVKCTDSCGEVIQLMQNGEFSRVPVVDDSHRLVGYTSTVHMLNKLAVGEISPSDPVSKVTMHFERDGKFVEITTTSSLKCVYQALDLHPFVIVTEKVSDASSNSEDICHIGKTDFKVVHVIVKTDLLDFLAKKESK